MLGMRLIFSGSWLGPPRNGSRNYATYLCANLRLMVWSHLVEQKQKAKPKAKHNVENLFLGRFQRPQKLHKPVMASGSEHVRFLAIVHLLFPILGSVIQIRAHRGSLLPHELGGVLRLQLLKKTVCSLGDCLWLSLLVIATMITPYDRKSNSWGPFYPQVVCY